MGDDTQPWPTSVWCWHKGVHRRRWLVSLDTGRIARSVTVPPDPRMRVPMAGWARRCATVPVAVFTPDRRHLLVQRRAEQFDLRAPGVTVRRRSIGPVEVLTLDAPGQRRIRVRDWVWSERFLDPMDDRFLDMLERLASQPEFDFTKWDPHGSPPTGEDISSA